MTKNSQTISIVFSLIIICIIGFLIYHYKGQSNFSIVPVDTNTPSSNNPSTPPVQSGSAVTVDGTVVCLPHIDTSGPQTLECAYGLKDTQGKYYSLSDTDPTYKNISSVPMNVPVRVVGQVTYKTDSRYQSIGVIAVTSISPTTPEEVISPQTAVLQKGETKSLNGISVTFNSITEDSRCPVNVNCIWAGRVVASVTLAKGGTTTQTVSITASGEPVVFSGYKVSITDVQPAPVSGHTSSGYKITVQVEK
jgi:hypothetical protein